MQQKHVFWGKYFGKSVFGHFFCPFLIFPKNFPSKKHDILYIISLGVLKADGPISQPQHSWRYSVLSSPPFLHHYRQTHQPIL
jgi:hypothetical protein